MVEAVKKYSGVDYYDWKTDADAIACAKEHKVDLPEEMCIRDRAYPFVRLLLLVGFTETPHSFGDTRFWMHFRIWQTMLPLRCV